MQITENIHEREKESCSSHNPGTELTVNTHPPTRQKRFPKVERRSFQPGDYWWWSEACEQQWGWWWWGTKLARALSLSLSLSHTHTHTHTHTDQLRLVSSTTSAHTWFCGKSGLITHHCQYLLSLSSSVIISVDSGVWMSGGVWSAVVWGKFFCFVLFCVVGFWKNQYWTQTFVVILVSKERRSLL
jgi:hypothetical protein